MQYKYNIITFGCQMNKNDSERMESVLCNMGLEKVGTPEEADVIIMNSCSVRDSEEDRIFGGARNFAKLKKNKPNLIVAVTGCMPGRDKDKKLFKKLQKVDLYFPTADMVKLPDMLCKLNPDFRKINLASTNLLSTDDKLVLGLDSEYLKITPKYKNDFQAFIPIQTGCDHFCTYCAVPYARGREKNRPLQDILEEIKKLAKNGCKEITLLGEIVNHYVALDPEFFSKENKYSKNDFAKLLWEVNQVEGIERIHWTGPHPIYMDDEVIDALTLPKQINFLHLPVQSGSTEVLRKMNRKHDREFFIDLIKKIKAKKPGISIGTDIIVGFCGESLKEFQDTVDMYKECDFDISYPAKYSTRSGTVADKAFKDDVSIEEKKRRWFVLQDLMKEITYKKNQKFIGKTASVLVERYKDGICAGNSSEMRLTHFSGDKSLVGKIVEVKIKKADTWLLEGDMV